MTKGTQDLEMLRHSTTHIMADAVMQLFPNVKLGIGPAIENGFYYDFDMEHVLKPEDLPKIEAKMKEIIKKNLKFEKREMDRKEAIQFFKEKGQTYKVELLKKLDDANVTIYQHGDFVDLCKGPHVNFSKKIKAFKLLSIAGAYWLGSEKNKMLQRIYGTAFPTKEELEKYLNNLEEAHKRDHRRLGKELDLFSIHEECGAGFVYWHPKGAMLRSIIEEFLKKENLKRGYEFVAIPHIAKIDLFQTSGHTGYYKENMYFMEIDKQDYVIKPMNCPGHITIFKRKLISYRDLPIRYFEFGTVYRYEKSGVLHGLLRVRGFTQDDAHIFCRPDQLMDEIHKVIEFVDFVMKKFGYEYKVILALRPEKFVGSPESWDHAEEILEEVLKKNKIDYEPEPGGGVFYGPKIDIKLKDALGRLWQGPTIQVDFNLPERFDLTYTGEDGKKHRPVMIHRAILGSLERFIGGLIEHYGGNFPLWLAPTQVAILPLADRHNEYANNVAEELQKQDFRVTIDTRSEKIGNKIRNAEVEKIPYMLIIGDKEMEAKKVSVRKHGKGDLGQKSVKEITASFVKEL
ncbi:MAG: threonine--tRNA ligase [Candidatus Margulisbacteria bacterium]|nr:threonine--tRNA ligase [Candidatus Margulisiibacteriota bacterium]MBU1021734.1 threonine--tRNA ligase [Candidatus Margulisiibacteriota bacterium]MBU1729480.1 threonine--tRNA ligase [Candidatus Margulisiibacteriota bacterium]MBU1955419.1 threonine--tRNA ligase [Candidatus Margulisiibacteriota bacterium]